MRKLRWILLLLALCAALTLPALAADATPPATPTEGDVWDGTAEAPSEIIQRDGVSYYRITKCSQLAYLATVEDGSDWGKYSYILENNLILNDVEFTWDEEGNLLNDTAELKQWTPISTFYGKILGNGYLISGLYVENQDQSGGGLFRSLGGSLDGIHVVNSFVSQGKGAAGLSNGGKNIENCSFSGVVRSDSVAGGLVIRLKVGNIINCTNYARVYGKDNVGGIVGELDSYEVENCVNYGDVTGTGNVGGIAGKSTMYHVVGSQNYGMVQGECYVGGIMGMQTDGSVIRTSCNLGCVKGKQYVGGISGAITKSDNIYNCYNLGIVEGEDFVGGLTGNVVGTSSRAATVFSSYQAGPVTWQSNGGMIAGKSDSIWGTSKVVDCYYLKTDDTLQSFGNYTGDIEGSVTGLSEAELKNRETFPAYEYVSGKGYVGWNFDEIWAIDPEKNGGYPYLQGQELEEIPVTGVSLNKTALTLGAGDQEYLVAAVSPATAKNTACTWRSSAPAVASVSDQGRVEALTAGQAVITVTTVEGGFTASCTVTVTERSQTEYRINGIALTDAAGADLDAIPQGSFWVTVSLTHVAAEGDAMVMLASYDASGRYLGMLCARAEDLPVGSSIRLSVWMDNNKGEIAHVRAFLVPSLVNLTPIGESVGF